MIYHYSYDLNTRQITPVLMAQVSGAIKLVDASPMGQGVVFPAFSTSITAPAPITCPGFLPSRLRENFGGRVTPGAANRMRSGPGLGFDQVGQIPGSEYFFVIEGPICADSMAWWRVNYNGIEAF